jgi:hypothetical protein
MMHWPVLSSQPGQDGIVPRGSFLRYHVPFQVGGCNNPIERGCALFIPILLVTILSIKSLDIVLKSTYIFNFRQILNLCS